MPAFDPVTAAMRSLEVLRMINHLEHASVTAIHKVTGIPKPTVLRMIETLISAGYVVREGEAATYAATGKCLLLSNGFSAHTRLTAAAAPFLNAFRKKVGWPSDFGMFDGDAMVIAATSRESGVLSINRKVGARTPMLLSALGRAYIAFCGEEECRLILGRLRESHDPLNESAHRPASVKRLCDEIRRRGFSLTDRKYLETVYDGAIWGIGVPILVGGRAIAAMNVMFLRSALSLEAGCASLVPALQRTAREIGSELEKNSSGLAAVD